MYLKFNSRTMFLICFFILLSQAIISCEHNVDDHKSQTGKSLSFTMILNDVFISCTNCHLKGAKSSGLDLSDYANIVNIKSTEKPSLMLIKPGIPDSSYLYMKVTGDEGITGSRMPLGGRLTVDQLDLLRDWILAGAPE